MVDLGNIKQESQFRYRADVDGLRAVAVLMVLFFHAGFGFTGGYVGVDVFFVISGFLITGLILQQQSRGTFRMTEFWKRRIRRILPVATLVVAVTLAAGYFLLLPHDLKDLAESAIYQQLMAANFYFWHHTGYFDGPAELKPLLHTWSLAVEEQFYLAYPVILILLSRLSRVGLLAALSLAALLSFVLSAIMVAKHSGATFYALPTRAWELLLGSILAAWPSVLNWKHWFTELVGLAGMAMIIGAGLFFDSATTFPGPNALVPCLGTVMVIAAGMSNTNVTQRLLSCRPIVFIGLVSYSLYLWHWPLLTFQRYWFGDHIAAVYRLGGVLASFALAVLSWRYVETPFRTGKGKKEVSGRTITIAVMASTIVMLGLGIWTLRSEGYPQRMPAAVLTIIEDSTGSSERKAMNSEAITCNLDRLPLLGETQPDAPISFVLWGDSHALAVAKLCDKLGKDFGIQGALATKSGTAALLGQSQFEQEAIEWNDAVLAYMLRNKVDNAIIVSRWSVCAQAGDQEEMDRFAKALDHTVQSLSEKGIRVWIMMQVPEQLENPQKELALAAWSGRSTPVGITREQHAEIQQPVTAAFSDFDSSIVLSPDAFCFDSEGRSRIGSSGNSFYRDDDHLSEVGTLELIQPLLRPVFVLIADQNNGDSADASTEAQQGNVDSLTSQKRTAW